MALEEFVSFSGVALVGADIHELTGRLRSYREPLKKAVKEVIIPSMRQNFDAEGRPEPWPELAEATISRRQYEGYPAGPILNRSGQLRKTMGQLNIWTINKDEAYIKDLPAQVDYGIIHDEGDRPFAMIQPEDEVPIERIFEEHFMRGVIF